MAKKIFAYQDVIAEKDSIRDRRVADLWESPVYRKVIAGLTYYEIYVLHKMDALLKNDKVLDTYLYADSPEIEAFLTSFNIAMLRVRPACDWDSHANDLGSLKCGEDAGTGRVIGNEEELKEVLRVHESDLQLLHYQKGESASI